MHKSIARKKIYMFDMEKQIKNYTSTFSKLNKYHKNMIEDGSCSYLKTRYNINIDENEKLTAFRSEYDFDYRTCTEEDKINKQAEIDFNKKVKRGEIEYKDIEAYDEIVSSLKKQNYICIKCMENYSKECEIEKSNSALNKIQIKREEWKFNATKDISAFHAILMTEIRDSLNNQDSIFRSYSKYLAAPLFKYSNNGSLYINHFITNSISAEFTVSFFDRDDHFDSFGNKKNRYYQETQFTELPLRVLASKENLTSYILPNIDLSDRDIDNIEFTINDVTVDISNIKRSSFDQYYNSKDEIWIKRFASYKKDKEILTTIQSPNYVIKNKKLLQLIRFIYLLKISLTYTYSINEFIYDLCDSKHLNLVISDNERIAFSFICEYLNDSNNVVIEKQQYSELYNSDSASPYNLSPFNSIAYFFEFVLKKPDLYKNIFDGDFLKELLLYVDL